MIKPDFGRTAQDYRQFRAGFPIELKAPLAAHGVGHPDQDVLDIGTGTGSLARLLAPHVRSVQGVDPSPQLLEQAAAIDAGAGVSVTYRVGTAEQTGLPSESVDVVTAGQCWHWFDADAAAVECARVLRPEGLIAIVHFDWIPLPGNVVEATEKLIERRTRSGLWAAGPAFIPVG
ncbi:MAG: class I SAM-dependent methyltransferase [Pseudonocardia sp.]|nr:class I SAM-dependent methyltransferase [Pseudonocardia sp.]